MPNLFCCVKWCRQKSNVDLNDSQAFELDEDEVRLITRKNEKKKKHTRAQARLAQISLVSFAFFSLGR